MQAEKSTGWEKRARYHRRFLAVKPHITLGSQGILVLTEVLRLSIFCPPLAQR